ncbi:MAG: hypothetical protein GY730_07335 [bacterium]|nr:hypothetical protein [bacterium]
MSLTKKILAGIAISFIVLVILLRLLNIINPVDKINISNYPLAKENISFYKVLKQTIKLKTENIPLNKITPFKWKKACFYGPYTSPVSWVSDDSYWTIIFTLEDSKELALRIPRGLVDFDAKQFSGHVEEDGTIYFYYKDHIWENKSYNRLYIGYKNKEG